MLNARVGLITAPLVGVLSDRCTSPMGRRRPFILGGLLATLAGMNLFANAKALSLGSHPAGIFIAFIGFAVLDFSTNIIMFPARALMGDLLPADEQHSVQGAAAVLASFAEISAGAYIFSWDDPVTHVSRVFVVASILLAVSCSISLVVCKEVPLAEMHVALAPDSELELQRFSSAVSSDEEDEAKEQEPFESADSNEEHRLSPAGSTTGSVASSRAPPARPYWIEVRSIMVEAAVNFPRPLIKVGFVYGLSWACWFASLPYYSAWLGIDVLKGDPAAAAGSPEALLYERGVSVFSAANVVKAVLALIFSAFYPTIIRLLETVGERVVYGLSFLVFSTALFLFAYTNNVYIAASVIALGSVPFIATQTIPVAIAVQRYPDHLASNLGILYVTLSTKFSSLERSISEHISNQQTCPPPSPPISSHRQRNLFCVIPQLLDTLYTGRLAQVASEAAVMRVASCWGFAAAIGAIFLL